MGEPWENKQTPLGEVPNQAGCETENLLVVRHYHHPQHHHAALQPTLYCVKKVEASTSSLGIFPTK